MEFTDAAVGVAMEVAHAAAGDTGKARRSAQVRGLGRFRWMGGVT